MNVAAALVAIPSNTGSGGHHASAWWGYLVGAVLIAAGFLFLAKPQLQWRWTRWQYKNPSALEPSSKGLVMIRVSAAVSIVVGVVFIVIAATH